MGGTNNRPDESHSESDFALVPDRENADFFGGNHKSVQGNVSGMAVRDDQFAQFAFEAPSDQWVRGKVLDRGLDRIDCSQCSGRIFVAQKLECALNMIESSR
jgi:methyl coenzyme M reductase gamma subunit